MLELIPVIPSGGCCIRRLNEEACDGHRGEQGADSEEDKVEVVLLLLEELLPVPEGGGNPEDQAQLGSGGHGLVGGCDSIVGESLRELHLFDLYYIIIHSSIMT